MKDNYFCFFFFLSAEIIQVFDGNSSMKRRLYRTISVPKNAPAQAILVSYSGIKLNRKGSCNLRLLTLGLDPCKFSDSSPVGY